MWTPPEKLCKLLSPFQLHGSVREWKQMNKSGRSFVAPEISRLQSQSMSVPEPLRNAEPARPRATRRNAAVTVAVRCDRQVFDNVLAAAVASMLLGKQRRKRHFRAIKVYTMMSASAASIHGGQSMVVKLWWGPGGGRPWWLDHGATTNVI